MSTALRIAHGAFGRVALLDMDWSLVRHAHPHCHVLLKVEGADTQFVVGDKVYPLTNETAVLVNGWQPHSYVHDPKRPRTVILALYIEPEWLMAFRPGWAASGAPGFFSHPSGDVSPRIRGLAMNLAADMMARPEARTAHEAVLSDLMISVIERFTPWRSFPASIREMNVRSGDWRIRKVAASMRSETRRGAALDTLRQGGGIVARAFLPIVRGLDRRAAQGLSECRAHGEGGRRGSESIRNRLRHQRPARLCGACAFHPLLSQPCRREPARVPKRFPARELMLHRTGDAK